MADIIPTEDQLRDWITNGADAPVKRNQYPAEAIEPTLALLGYLYRRCDGNLQTLVEHARLKGFNNDYNYFYQLLTARYFRPDPKTGKPQGAWKSVRALWMQLQVYDRFATKLSRVLFVDTSVFDRINSYIQIKRTPFNACRFGAIVGHTGSGKSESFNEIMRREKPGTVFRIEAPAVSSLSQFIHKVGNAFGSSPSSSVGTKRNDILEKLAGGGRTLIVDNVQRCFSPRAGTQQPIFNYLQEIQEDTNCTVIISWTPIDRGFGDAFTGAAYFEQFVGRIGGEREILRLEDYPLDEDIEMIATSFKLTEKDVEELMPRLRSLVREKGRIRNLFNALQQAKRLANAAEEDIRAVHVTRYLGT